MSNHPPDTFYHGQYTCIDFYQGTKQYSGNVFQFLKGLELFDRESLDHMLIKIVMNIFQYKIDLSIKLVNNLSKCARVVEAISLSRACEFYAQKMQHTLNNECDALYAS